MKYKTWKKCSIQYFQQVSNSHFSMWLRWRFTERLERISSNFITNSITRNKSNSSVGPFSEWLNRHGSAKEHRETMGGFRQKVHAWHANTPLRIHLCSQSFKTFSNISFLPWIHMLVRTLSDMQLIVWVSLIAACQMSLHSWHGVVVSAEGYLTVPRRPSSTPWLV